jgi:hypothetical protein
MPAIKIGAKIVLLLLASRTMGSQVGWGTSE